MNENSTIERLYSKYNKSILSKSEIAHELGISIKTVNYRMAEKKDIPNYFKDGKFVKFAIESVAEYLDKKRFGAIKTIY